METVVDQDGPGPQEMGVEMSAGAVIWGLYGLATIVAVIVFYRYARKRRYSFDVLDGIIVALLWPFFLTLGIFGELEDPEDPSPGDDV